MRHRRGGRRPAALALVLGLVLAAIGPPGTRADIGLAAKFGEVVLEGAQPGKTYSLSEAAHVPLGIKNVGDADAEYVVEFERPLPGGLSPGYDPIPDPSWMKSIPDKLRIAKGGEGFFELLLSVPDDPKLKGRSFQVMVKVRHSDTTFLAAGVMNKVRFSIGPGPEALKEEKKRKAMQQLDFDVTPHGPLYLTEVPIGRTWDSRKESRKSIRIANYARDPLSVTFSVAPWSEGTPMPDGFEVIPDTSWIHVVPSTVTVRPDEIEQTGIVVQIPNETKYHGRHWAALVKTGLITGFWLDAPVRILLETKPLETKP